MARSILKPVGKHSSLLDLRGRQYGHLRVVRESATTTAHNRGVPYNVRNWLCECSCGTRVTRRQSALTTKATPHTSCGCQRRNLNKGRVVASGSQSSRWTGHKQISGAYWSNLKSHAKRRHLAFTISIQDAWSLFESQNGRCALSGQVLTFDNTDGLLRTASLDRIDSSLPYTVSNVQWVDKRINKMKMDLPEALFIELCGQIASHRRNIGTI